MARESLDDMGSTTSLASMAGTTLKIGLTSNDPGVAGLPDTPAPVVCEFCGAERYTEGARLFGKIIWFPGGANPCTCPDGRAQYAREQTARKLRIEAMKQAEADARMRARVWRVIRESGMGERFRQRTFETFVANTPQRQNIVRSAQAYARQFGDQLPKQGLLPDCNGLLITGSTGTGKTHIAAAIANYLLDRGTAVICMTERNILAKIRRTYSQHDDDECAVREVYERVPLLIIDDLGKEKPTEWTLATLYAIVDGRYERATPIIVTTNYDAKKLVTRLTPTLSDGKKTDVTTATAIMDRLTEMCKNIAMWGEGWGSWRRK
jgi:DNA replication protein DnaC